MPKADIKFIATDMDGTLLDENGKLSPEFFPLFERINDQNIHFAAASGRQYFSLVKTFEPVKDKMVFIAENGTMVMHQGRELFSSTMDRAGTMDIVSAAREINGAHIVLCGKRSAYIETRDPAALEEFAKYYHECQYVDDLLAVDDEFIKVAICHFDGTEQHVNPVISPKFKDNFKVVVSAKIWLDVMHASASKGEAIRFLQQSMGFSHEQTMSFGDYFNDLEMLEESYYSFAVDNAHEGIKKIARFNAPSNKEQGVLKVIDKYLLTGEV